MSKISIRYLEGLRLSGYSAAAGVLLGFQNSLLQFCSKVFLQFLGFSLQPVLLLVAVYPELQHSHVLLDDAGHTQTGQREAHLKVIIGPEITITKWILFSASTSDWIWSYSGGKIMNISLSSLARNECIIIISLNVVPMI